MRRADDFTRTVRSGARARGEAILVHHLAQLDPGQPARVGLFVGRSVGGSVVRHRVARRLRAQLGHRLDRLPTASGTVIRALPATAHASSAQLGAALDTAFHRLHLAPVSADMSPESS